MSIDEKLIRALTPIVGVVEPNVYGGAAMEYAVFNYSELPISHGDNRPGAVRYVIQIHWFLPSGKNPLANRRRIKLALEAAGFTYPSVTNASDGDGQHYVFECEHIGGDA